MSCTLDSDTSIPPQKWDLFSTGLKATVTVRWPVRCTSVLLPPTAGTALEMRSQIPKSKGRQRVEEMHAVSKDPRSLIPTCSNTAPAWVCWVGRSVPARGSGGSQVPAVEMMQYQDKVRKRTQPPRAAASTRGTIPAWCGCKPQRAPRHRPERGAGKPLGCWVGKQAHLGRWGALPPARSADVHPHRADLSLGLVASHVSESSPAPGPRNIWHV